MMDTVQSTAGVPIVEQLQSMLLEQAELFQRDRTRRGENEKFYRETIERQQCLNDSVLTRLLDRLDKVEGQHSAPDISAIAANINRSGQSRRKISQTQGQHPQSSNQIPFQTTTWKMTMLYLKVAVLLPRELTQAGGHSTFLIQLELAQLVDWLGPLQWRTEKLADIHRQLPRSSTPR